MPKTEGLAALILEATGQGFDVEVRIRERDDGKEGELKLPFFWAQRLGYEPANFQKSSDSN